MGMKNKIYHVMAMLLLAQPIVSFSQEGGDAFRDIEPPPAPINDYVIYFAVATVLFVGYYFSKVTLKKK